MLNYTWKSVCFSQACTFLTLTAIFSAPIQTGAAENSGKDADVMARIRDEGLNHSEAMETIETWSP